MHRADHLLIRSAKPADAAAIQRLNKQLGYAVPPPYRGLFVAQQGARVVGWIHLHRWEDRAEVIGLVVDSRARSRGVGGALMQHAERWTRARGLSKLRVRSNVIRERAHSFYKRLGFTETKRQVVLDKAL